MALAPQNQDAFFREVDDEVRRDRLAGFWSRWGRWLIAGTLGFLVALAGLLYWQHRTEARRGAEGEALSQALADAGGTAPAAADAKLDALAKDAAPGTAGAARLAQAGLAANRGDVKGAIVAYDGVANDAALPQTYRDLATIRGTTLAFDTLPPGTVIARMQPYAVAGNAWFGSASELTAMAMLKAGRRAEAGRTFAAAARDPSAPETLRARTRRMAGILGADVPPEAGEGGTGR